METLIVKFDTANKAVRQVLNGLSRMGAIVIEKSPYNEEFVQKITKGDRDLKAEKGKKVNIDELEVIFTPDAHADPEFWQRSGNRAVQSKMSLLLASICQTPFEGPGKPEALKYELAGKWSRRIDREHRIVYAVTDQQIFVYSLRGRYKK